MKSPFIALLMLSAANNQRRTTKNDQGNRKEWTECLHMIEERTKREYGEEKQTEDNENINRNQEPFVPITEPIELEQTSDHRDNITWPHVYPVIKQHRDLWSYACHKQDAARDQDTDAFPTRYGKIQPVKK